MLRIGYSVPWILPSAPLRLHVLTFLWLHLRFPVRALRSLVLLRIALTFAIMPARNPTGFDMAQFKAAASPSSVYAKRDPWARKYVLDRLDI